MAFVKISSLLADNSKRNTLQKILDMTFLNDELWSSKLKVELAIALQQARIDYILVPFLMNSNGPAS